jgi:hypothetical protein
MRCNSLAITRFRTYAFGVDESESFEQTLMTRLDALADTLGFEVEHTSEADPSELIAVKPDLWVPARATGVIRTTEFPGTVFEIEVRWDAEAHRYLLNRLEITSPDGITTSALHKYSIPRLVLALAAGEVLVELEGDDGMARFELALQAYDLTEIRARMKDEGPTRDNLEWVSRIYAWTAVMGGTPNRMVSSMFQLPTRTATRWIARARTDGLLD